MKNKVIYIHNLISVILLAVALCLLAVVGSASSTTVYAAPSPEVLQDLRKDKDFDESAYPYVKDDHGLYVIQIAESANKELFIYAYQPCHDTYDLVGTKVSISYGYSVDGSGLTPKLYNLDLLSTSGTLDKYHVVGFTVPNDGDRYYNIVEIFRMVNTEIDKVDPAFPKTDIAYSVGQQWYVCDLNDSKHYEMNTFNTLPVETVWNDYFKFEDGFTWSDIVKLDYPTDCWFYCFNVDEYVIKHIFDADLNYSIRHVEKTNYASHEPSYAYSNDRPDQIITLKDSDKMSHMGSGLGARRFEWNRILSSVKFIEAAESQGVNIDSTVRANILKSQWVFTFLETARSVNDNSSGLAPGIVGWENYEDVYEVGLFRLHFQDMSGNYYDLGVVNDLTDPDDTPGGVGEADLRKAFEEFWDMFVKTIATIVFVVLVVLLLNFVSPIKSIFSFIFKGVKFVISSPFKLLKSIFKKGG